MHTSTFQISFLTMPNKAFIRPLNCKNVLRCVATCIKPSARIVKNVLMAAKNESNGIDTKNLFQSHVCLSFLSLSLSVCVFTFNENKIEIKCARRERQNHAETRLIWYHRSESRKNSPQKTCCKWPKTSDRWNALSVVLSPWPGDRIATVEMSWSHIGSFMDVSHNCMQKSAAMRPTKEWKEHLCRFCHKFFSLCLGVCMCAFW